MLKKSYTGYTPWAYDNSSVSIEIECTWHVIITTVTRKVFMVFISKEIKKRISNLINRFDISKIPPNMLNKLGVEKEATYTN